MSNLTSLNLNYQIYKDLISKEQIDPILRTFAINLGNVRAKEILKDSINTYFIKIGE